MARRINDQTRLGELAPLFTRLQATMRLSAKDNVFEVLIATAGGHARFVDVSLAGAIDAAVGLLRYQATRGDSTPPPRPTRAPEPASAQSFHPFDEAAASEPSMPEEDAPEPDPDGCHVGPAPLPDRTGTRIGPVPAPSIDEAAS
jgi:hypothetical protein